MGSTRKRPQAVNRKASIADDLSSVNGDKKGVKRSATIKQGTTVDPAIEPMFQPRGLIPEIFDYNDALSENQINNMRERALQRALQLQKEKSRKAKLSRIGQSDDEGEKNANQADITKKDMTTDHNGKILAMKTLNSAKLPSMAP